MNNTNIVFNLIYKFFLFIAVMIMLTDPETVGQWQARAAIAYDTIWIEYLNDCECTGWGE